MGVIRLQLAHARRTGRPGRLRPSLRPPDDDCGAASPSSLHRVTVYRLRFGSTAGYNVPRPPGRGVAERLATRPRGTPRSPLFREIGFLPMPGSEGDPKTVG